jgi:transposase InsO family protein
MTKKRSCPEEIIGKLREAGWKVNKKRVEWIWRRKVLKGPAVVRRWILRATPVEVFRRRPGSIMGLKFCAKAVLVWLMRLGVVPRFIDPDSPWENG